MIGVLTYSMIINCFYLNIDVGAYYAAGDGGSRTVEITDNWYTQLEYDRIKYMTPEQFNPDYGLHFRLGIGFGIPNDEVYYETGIWYPTVVGFSTGISVNISFAELLNLPAEDYNQYWDIGLWMGIPFFLQI
ncbi:MAG: hypothetical protein HPY53_16845 [Brevinematales bacterium]|nr:hypothetical protein [Brevinematales bacterium]